MPIQLSSIAKQSVTYLLGDAARRMVAVIMLPFYTRYLTPAEYGLIELIDLFVMVATITFGVLAVSDSMIRIYHQYGGKQGSGDEAISTALWSCAILSGASLTLAVPLAAPISTLLFHAPQHGPLLIGAFAAVFFGNLVELGFIYQRIRQRAILFVVLSLAQLTINVGLNIWFIAFRGTGVWGFILAKLVSGGIMAAVILALTTREVGLRFNWEKAVSMLKFGLPLIVSSVSIFVIHFSDRFFLSRYSTLAQVGVYALAYKIAFMVTYMVGEPFGRVWSVSLYGYTSEPKWQADFARMFRYLAFALCGAALALSLFSGEVLALATTSAYGAAAALVAPIAFGYALREGGDFFRGVLFINKRTKIFGIIAFGCAVLNTALNFWLIPSWGPMGAALATFLTWLAYMAACWVTAMKEHHIPYPTSAFLKLFLVACVIYWLGRQVPSGQLLISLLIKTVLMAVFLATVLLSRYFSRSEVRQFRTFLLRRYQRLISPASRVYSS